MLSATPLAIFPMDDAVAGAMTIASAQSPRSTCEFHWPVLAVKNSLITGCPLSVDNVTGVMNSLAFGVIITCTSAPAFTNRRTSDADLYAAIPPVIPTTICFPFITDLGFGIVISAGAILLQSLSVLCRTGNPLAVSTRNNRDLSSILPRQAGLCISRN